MKRISSFILLLAAASGILLWIACEHQVYPPNSGIVISTSLRVFPQDDVNGYLLVNLSEEHVSISSTVLVEREQNGIWVPFAADEHPESMPYVLCPNSTYSSSLAWAWENRETDRLGHFRVTRYNADTGEAYTGEFWVEEEVCWRTLDFTDVLTPSPFGSIVQSPDELGLPVKIDVSSCRDTTHALSFHYTVYNGSQQSISCGQEHYVEIYLNGVWYTTPHSGWDAVGYSILPGESLELTAYIRTKWCSFCADTRFSWPEGKYRLVKAFAFEDEGETRGNFQITAQEFFINFR